MFSFHSWSELTLKLNNVTSSFPFLSQLESIEETCESSTGLEDDDLTPACAPKLTLSPTSHSRPSTADRSASTATNSESNNSDSSTFSVAPNQVCLLVCSFFIQGYRRAGKIKESQEIRDDREKSGNLFMHCMQT